MMMTSHLRRSPLCLSLLSLSALTSLSPGCKTDPEPAGDDIGEESGSESESDTTEDTGESEGGGDEQGCAYAGFEAQAFDPSGTDNAIGEVVPDFTVETLRGPFTLSEAWGDCSVVTLVPISTIFAGNDVTALIEGSAPNNTYLLFSRGPNPTQDVAQLAAAIEGHLESLGPDAVDEWSFRFRYVTEAAAEVPVLAATAPIQTDFFIIDSHQRLRDAGSFNTYAGDFTPFLPMIRFAARWFNYERRTEELLAAREADPDVLIVPWVTTGHEQTDEGRLAIELPDADTMAKYDRVEIVVKETCEPGSRFPVHFGVCPAWDVGHKISLCEDFETCTGDEYDQLFRYITGYHSGIWWREDVSHGLPFFRQGGTQWLRTNRGDFFGTIDFHFIDDGEQAPEAHLADARHLHDMGTASFDPAHNDSFPNYSFTPPPGTVRVVMDARVQGGGNGTSGCAEFCSHSHAIEVNGAASWEHTFVMNQGTFDCAERVDEGVTTGQYGTWFFDRGSWCPGGQVERWREDITEAVDLDGENTLVWTGSFNGNPWPPNGGLTSTVWLLFYGEDGEAIVDPIKAPSCPNPPTVTVRDFPLAHPDFQAMQDTWNALEDGDPTKEMARGELTGVVAPTLVEVDGEWKPQLIWPEDTLPYSTAANFDDWWRDSEASETTAPEPGTFIQTRQDTTAYLRSSGPLYAANPLIPADFGYGDEGLSFNLHGQTLPVNTTYTVEVVGAFEYSPGLRLRLGSKSDLFVFVDHQLVLESGGFLGKGFPKHILELDEVAAQLGLEAGQSYDMHVFAVASRGPSANPHIWLEHPACL